MIDREAIFDYLFEHDPRAALETDERIEQAAQTLGEHPRSGREGRVAGTRELVVTGTPYIAAYIVGREHLTVLRVIHGAQQWPEQLR